MRNRLFFSTLSVIVMLASQSVMGLDAASNDPNSVVHQINETAIEDLNRRKEEFLAGASRPYRTKASEDIQRSLGNLDVLSRRFDVFGGKTARPEDITVAPTDEPDLESELTRNAMIAAVQNLRVAGVSPERKEFYVGHWTIRAGEIMTLRHGESIFNFEVIGVTGEAISMLDIESKTRISARIHVVPREPTDTMGTLRN